MIMTIEEENIEYDFKDILNMIKIKAILNFGAVWFTGYVIRMDDEPIDNDSFKDYYNARIKWEFIGNNYFISNCILKKIYNFDCEILKDKYLIHSIQNKLFEDKIHKIDSEHKNNYNSVNYNINEKIETNYGENNYPFGWKSGIITAFINNEYTIKINENGNENEIFVYRHMIRKKGSREENITKEFEQERENYDLVKLLKELEFVKEENERLKNNLEITCKNSSVLEDFTLKQKLIEYEEKLRQQEQEQEIRIKEIKQIKELEINEFKEEKICNLVKKIENLKCENEILKKNYLKKKKT